MEWISLFLILEVSMCGWQDLNIKEQALCISTKHFSLQTSNNKYFFKNKLSAFWPNTSVYKVEQSEYSHPVYFDQMD